MRENVDLQVSTEHSVLYTRGFQKTATITIYMGSSFIHNLRYEK